VDEQSKREIKDLLLQYDRTLLVADPRRCEPKKCVCLSKAATASWAVAMPLCVRLRAGVRLLVLEQRSN